MSAFSRLGRLIMLVALLVPLGFAFFTNHVWEDYYITLRSSRNLVEGHGLVFQPGERLHTFTSPLGVLLPALFTWIGGGNDAVALWLFRFCNAGLLAATAGILWRRAVTLGVGSLGRFLLFGLLLFDPKLTDFSTNGMETAELVFFTVLLWSELERPEGARVLRLALAYAGLMWTRPDAFILAGALTVPHLIWNRAPAVSRGATIATVVKGALVGMAIYAPWFCWAWWYYGSPVPHTIIAKASQTPAMSPGTLLMIPWNALRGASMFDYLFLPANFLFGNWPPYLHGIAHVLVLGAVLAWLFPRMPAAGRRTSLSLVAGMFYLSAIMVFGWYVPPWTVLAATTLAFGADAVYRHAVNTAKPVVAGIVRIVAVAVVVLQLGLLLAVAWQMRVQQRVIEDGGRHQIGLWLKAHAAPGDSVFLEPLGYIGYYSQLKTYDFPGLSSKEVVAATKAGARNYSDVVQRLKPTWLVLRPLEIPREGFANSHVLDDYEPVHDWDQRAILEAVDFLPGRTWLNFDAHFVVYHRKAVPTAATRPFPGSDEYASIPLSPQ
ncbi:MAG TPA: hypothetical protein VFJ90_01555 [Candidatus Didemnitutus sp.]|nr:hypothetical protein [Candidatus Didemnitutus sp.]